MVNTPRIGDSIRDARHRLRVGVIEARVGDLSDPTQVHWYVAWNDGSRTLVSGAAVHGERLSIYGYLLIPKKR